MIVDEENDSLGFCIRGDYEFPCKQFDFSIFPNEKDVIVLILEYFKKGLPELLKTVDNRGKLRFTDYYNKPIVIDTKDIDLVVQKDFGKYLVVIAITDDNSSYPDERFQQENTDYAFQIDLQVIADGELETLENLIQLKSAVKTLLVNMDNNLNLLTTIDGFSYVGAGGIENTNQFVRQGIYRFSVQNNNYRK